MRLVQVAPAVLVNAYTDTPSIVSRAAARPLNWLVTALTAAGLLALAHASGATLAGRLAVGGPRIRAVDFQAIATASRCRVEGVKQSTWARCGCGTGGDTEVHWLPEGARLSSVRRAGPRACPPGAEARVSAIV